MLKLAILDDYAKIALQSADWSVLQGRAQITVFDRHLSEDEAASVLQPFDVLCTIRERMSLPRSLFQRQIAAKAARETPHAPYSEQGMCSVRCAYLTHGAAQRLVDLGNIASYRARDRSSVSV